MKLRAWWLAIALACVACEKSGGSKTETPAPANDPVKDPVPPAAATGKAPRGADLVVDGIRLGDKYGSTVMTRAEYQAPCDDDGIDGKTARAMVYGARPCRDHAFPDDTTVIIVIDWADNDDFDQPIRTFGWLGGHHFDTRVDLPIKVGDPASKVTATWGAPAQSRTVSTLVIHRYGDDLHVVTEHDVVVGFLVGAMPDGERWEVVEEMYRKYTPRVPAPGVTREACETILRKAFAWEGGGDAKRFEEKLPREIDQCVAEAPPGAVACALAAQSMDELDRCK